MITSYRMNQLQKSKHKSMYDRKKEHLGIHIGKIKNMKELNIHEYAEFQKEQFRKRRKEQKQRKVTHITAFAIVVLLSILLLWFLNDYDFGLLKAPAFQ